MTKALIFDLGNVIVPFDFSRAYRGMGDVCDYEPAEIRARIATTDLVRRFETGLMGPEEFVAELTGLLGLRVSYPRFCEIFSSIFLPETLIPDGMLASLRRGYPLLLLSNTNAIHFAMIRENYPALRHFDHFVLSHEVKAMKPAPAIYREAISRAGCRPEECFFTDDVAAYVEAARGEGMDAVQFVSREQLEKELRDRAIHW